MDDAADEVRFGPFVLSRRNRRLTGAEGPVPVGSRAFDLLVVLLDHRGALVGKQALMRLIWPGLIVEDNNLQVQVATLRRALGTCQGLIQTVPGRGYRFTGTIEAGPRPAVPVAAVAEQGMELVGRADELADVQALLSRFRLVTITGPGGIGKTRLATALAQRAERAGGVYLVDLAPLDHEMLVAGAVMRALGLHPVDPAAMQTAIIAALSQAPTLLLLDNCEHLAAGAAGLVGTLLQACPGLVILATSQEPLRLAAEAVYRLEPLALPPVGASDIARFGAVALFASRAEAIDRRFRLTQQNAFLVAEICRALDGIPLALEMAAARIPLLGVAGLHARLGERLRMLTSGLRDAEPRHRTLRDTIAWSYELLESADQRVFRGLGVFAGGFSAEAAAGVLGAEEDGWEVIDALGRLVDKSLAVADPGACPRYRLLETLRLFAREQLDANGERAGLAARHLAYYERLLDGAYATWESTDDLIWLQRHAPELDNVRAALEWGLEQPDQATHCVSLAGSAALLWDRLSLQGEGRRYLERALVVRGEDTPPLAAARLLRQVGALWHLADRPMALAALQEAQELYTALGARADYGSVLSLMGAIHTALGPPALATAVLQEAREILEAAGRRKSLFNVLNHLGVLAALNGEMDTAQDLFARMLALARASGQREQEAMAMINLAEVDAILGRFAAAAARTELAVEHLRAQRQHADLGWALVNLATYLLIDGQVARAHRFAAEALQLVRQIGGLILRACLQQWALLLAHDGALDQAARLAAYVDASYEAAGEQRQPMEQRLRGETQALLDGLPAARRALLREQGAAWTEQQASDSARLDLPPTEATPPAFGRSVQPSVH